MRIHSKNILIFLTVFITVILILEFWDSHRINESDVYTGLKLREDIPNECECKSEKTGKVHNFCYSLPYDPNVYGKKFDCKLVDYWEKIENGIKKYVDPTVDKLPEPVFVTAFSHGFLNLGKRLISTIRKLGMEHTMIIYDLGLNQKDIDAIQKTGCKVEIRKFHFHQYPNCTKKLKEYRWKPVVIAETLAEFGAVWYLDSSLIIKKSNLSHVYDLVDCQKNHQSVVHPMLSSKLRDIRESREPLENGWDLDVWHKNLEECRKSTYLLHGFSGHGIFPATNPDVYTYFPTNKDEIRKPKAKMYEAGYVYAVSTKFTMLNILKWYVLCALEEDCMGPKSAALQCRFGKDRFSEYANCHRYDQSIINLLLANAFWYDRHYYASEIVDFFQVSRGMLPDLNDPLTCIGF